MQSPAGFGSVREEGFSRSRLKKIKTRGGCVFGFGREEDQKWRGAGVATARSENSKSPGLCAEKKFPKIRGLPGGCFFSREEEKFRFLGFYFPFKITK